MPLPTLTITPAGGSPTTYLGPIDGFCAAAGNYYLVSGMAQGADYGIELNSAPAVSGQTVKRHQFRKREIKGIEVVYVSASVAGCLAQFESDHGNINNKNCTVVIPNDQSYPSCNVKSMEKRAPPKDCGNGKYRMHVLIEITQYRQT